MNNFKYFVVVVGMFLLIQPAKANFPDFPMSFYGEAKYNNSPIAVGAKIRAVANNNTIGEVEIKTAGIYGTSSAFGPNLSIGKFSGNTINFYYISPNSTIPLVNVNPIIINSSFVSGLVKENNFNFMLSDSGASSGGGGGGGGGAQATYCSTVQYGNWGPCIGSVQIRQVISSSPNSCTLTTSQQLTTTRDCIINNEEEVDNGDDPFKEIKEEGEGLLVTSGEGKSGDKLKQEVLQREKDNQASQSNLTLTNRLSGRILLQVEEKGEAWYIEPQRKQRHFMGRPADAFSMMREFGLGISENNFKNFQEKGVSSKFAGRIFLRVEANGEAYYVNPVNLKMHFLNRPDDAFRIMRELALGINNNNLRQITLGE